MTTIRIFLSFSLLMLFFGVNPKLFAQKEQHYKKLSELDSLTTIQGNSGNMEKAIIAAKEALSYAEKNLEAADSIGLILKMKYANTLILANFYDKAEKELNQLGIILKQKYPQSKIYADYLGLIGKNCFYLGKHEMSENYFQEQIEMLRIVVNGKGLDYAEALNNLGVLYADLKRFEEAEPLYILSKKIRKEELGAQSSIYGVSLNNLAILYKNLKRFEEAETLYLENLNIQKNLSERSYALSLNNLAIYYSATAQEKKALPLLLQAAEIGKRISGEENPLYARIMHNLGEAYNFFKDYTSSEKHFLKAIEIREKLFEPQHPDLLESYASLAYTYLDSGDTLNMWKYIQKGFEHNGFKADFPTVFDDNFRHKMEKTEFLNLAKAISMLSPIYKYYSLKMLAAPKDMGLKKEALNICKTVLYLEGKYRLSFAAENDKLRNAAELVRWNKYAMALSFELSKVKNEVLTDAFLVAERNKSIILLNTLKAQKARSFGELPDSLIRKESNLQKEMSQIEKQLIETKDDSIKAVLLEKKNILRSDSKAFKRALEEKYPKYYKLKYSASNVDLSALQQRIPKNALMLEYYIADSLLYIFSLSKTDLKIIREEINPELLKNQIKKLRRSLSDYDFIKNQTKASCDDFKESAFWFYDKILAKALKTDKKIDYLIIIPDAELGHLPFEVFLTEKTTLSDYSKMPYLVNKYKISYNYSAALWLENIGQGKLKNNAKIFAAAASYSNKGDTLRSTTNIETELFKKRQHLQDLPKARAEVETLEKLFMGSFLIGANAVESEFKRNAGNYAVIHLAMHGMLNPQYPILSSLAFTESRDNIEDNFLQAYEVSNMKLNADMVVLSACETGYGRFEQGEGVMSLARSFMYAGVPSLVVSLWQVNDASTAKIMQLFYKNLSAGMDKAEALRQAKLSYIKGQSGIMTHPAFWAAFVQLGDSSPIKIKEKNEYSAIIWLSIGIAVVLMLSVFIYLRRKNHKP